MIEFRVLGPIEVDRDGVAVALGGPRQHVLLALLLVAAPQPVPIDRLADELWHGEPPDGASTTLRAYVSKLRTVLGDGAAIRSSAGGYALDADGHHVDAARFERLAREGHEALERGATRAAATRLRQALDLWRGPPFAGVGEDGALLVEAQRLDDLRLSAFEDRIEADLALGQDAELVDELERLVRDNPYRERLWRHLMLALYRAERQTDALAAYRRARSLLADELGLEPGEELQRLEQSILRHEVPAARPPEERHNLPAQVSSFVGRETELADIARLLGTSRLLTLTGVGGVGKTRLALEAAGRALDDSPDGVFLVDLSALTEPALVVRQVATALGVREQADAPLAEQLVARLRDADLLIVLDNCEHVREACAELCGRLLESCPRLRVLGTSRDTLGVPGEVDYPVPPLPVPSTEADLDELRASDAVRLFLARAGEAQPRRAEVPGAVPMAARICRDLDGLPLAIELAAARAKAFSFEEIASRLDDRFQFLISWRRLAPARHRTLRAAMDWSYELLSDEERTLLDRLSVFVGGFTLADVADVCLDGLDAGADDLVGRLVDASLVVPEERDVGTRYRLLETVRQYAGELLETRGETRGRSATSCRALPRGRRGRPDTRSWAGPGHRTPRRRHRQPARRPGSRDRRRATPRRRCGWSRPCGRTGTFAATWRKGRDRLEAAIARDGATASGAYTPCGATGPGSSPGRSATTQRVRALATELLAAAAASDSRWDEHAANKLLSPRHPSGARLRGVGAVLEADARARPASSRATTTSASPS